MIFEKDLIVTSKQRADTNTIDFYIALRGLQSNNAYQIKLTVGEVNYYASEFAIPIDYVDSNNDISEKTYQPKYLEITQLVDGNVTTKNIDIVQTYAYDYNSPYYWLIKHFYALYYTFKEDTFIEEFFADCPDYVSENVNIYNPVVTCKPASNYLYKYLHYQATSSNFDLYLEPIDNSNQFQLLNSLNQVPDSHLSHTDYIDIMAIEAYNRNYLLAHLQPNVSGNLEITGDINASTSGGSGGSSTVDLSGVVTQLQNINEKLNYEDVSGDADIAELLYWIAQALQGGLVYADDQQGLHSYLHFIGKKLEYTQIVEEEEVTKNISQIVSELTQKLQDLSDRPIINTNEDLSPWSKV